MNEPVEPVEPVEPNMAPPRVAGDVSDPALRAFVATYRRRHGTDPMREIVEWASTALLAQRRGDHETFRDAWEFLRYWTGVLDSTGEYARAVGRLTAIGFNAAERVWAHQDR